MSGFAPTKEQIEAARGHFFVKPNPPYPDPPRRPPRELKGLEKEQVSMRKAAVYEHLPELVPFIKELHEAGLIDGWRSVGEVVLFNEGKEHGTA